MALPLVLAFFVIAYSKSLSDLEFAAQIAFAAITISLCLVGASAVVLGAPLTIVLHRANRESEAAYAFTGGILGFIVPGMIVSVVEGDVSVFFNVLVFNVIGACSGAITGSSWWRNYRKDASKYTSDD